MLESTAILPRNELFQYVRTTIQSYIRIFMDNFLCFPPPFSFHCFRGGNIVFRVILRLFAVRYSEDIGVGWKGIQHKHGLDRIGKVGRRRGLFSHLIFLFPFFLFLFLLSVCLHLLDVIFDTLLPCTKYLCICILPLDNKDFGVGMRGGEG